MLLKSPQILTKYPKSNEGMFQLSLAIFIMPGIHREPQKPVVQSERDGQTPVTIFSIGIPDLQESQIVRRNEHNECDQCVFKSFLLYAFSKISKYKT